MRLRGRMKKLKKKMLREGPKKAIQARQSYYIMKSSRLVPKTKTQSAKSEKRKKEGWFLGNCL
jgi:hypothetical protein